MPPKKTKSVSVYTRCNEYKEIFRVNDNILFCNYCNISIEWKYKYVVDNHCKNLIEAFAIADIPLKKVNCLLPFFKKYVKNGGSISQASTLRQIYLSDIFDKHYQSLRLLFDSKPVVIIMDEITDDCARSVVNTLFCYHNKTKLVSVNFPEHVNNTTMGQILTTILSHFNISFNLPRIHEERYLNKKFLDKIKKVFVHSPAQREELENDRNHNTLTAINSYLQSEQKLGLITIYLNFISLYAAEFVQDLDFFQQSNKPIFPLVELRLQHLTAYIKTYRNSSDFGLFLKNLIIGFRFNTNAFEAAYNKFSAHIPNHPARLIFHACQVFDSKFIQSGDILRKNI
ncbi:hypothetical protein RhiirC2_857989 [Rhizophagus irregularis]|uniref:Uncharacterized protein n=1 Tax=Rhizophagus irregularis TaxID=588596 RepID=A0A2N1M8N1_9GLOM|nr:hypothetical protein RhiirC2_857989 [Rhizophagus irregularis]